MDSVLRLVFSTLREADFEGGKHDTRGVACCCRQMRVRPADAVPGGGVAPISGGTSEGRHLVGMTSGSFMTELLILAGACPLHSASR